MEKIDDAYKQKFLDTLIQNQYTLYTCSIDGFFKLRNDVNDAKCPHCERIGKRVLLVSDL